MMMLLETVLQDMRYGVRVLRRNPGFTVVAVLALAMGIGVNTAVFTAYKAMVARRLDARDPKQMVNLALMRDLDSTEFTFSYPDYVAYLGSAHSFNGLIAFDLEHMRLTNAGEMISQRASAAESGFGKLGLGPSGASNAEFASVYVVSENYFKVLGVTALRGRTFDAIPSAELAESPPVLVSENYWQKRFGGDPGVLGKSIQLNGVAMRVVGVTPHDFVGTSIGVPNFWLPLSLAPRVHADDRWLTDHEHRCCRLFARLAPGVSIAQARAEMNLLANRIRRLPGTKSELATPVTMLIWPGSPFPLPLNMLRGLELTIFLIMASAAMVLVVACANVSSLQLVRARSRQDELTTRLSLGASRVRVIRQLLTESALLGLLAGLLALLFSWAFLRISASAAAQIIPADQGTLIFDVTPDLTIFSYVFAVSVIAGVLLGLAPAMESSRSALYSARSSTSPLRSRRIQSALIAAQVAFSMVLMIAGSMLIHSSINTLETDPGYDGKHVISVDLQFPTAPKYSGGSKSALVADLRIRLSELTGVAEITSARAPGNDYFQTAAAIEDKNPGAQSLHLLHYTFVQPNYFHTLGIPVSGQVFRPQNGESDRSIILSESAAKELWPGQNPIGRSLRLGTIDEKVHDLRKLVADGPAYQVIGLAHDVRGTDLNASDAREVYLALPDNRLYEYPVLIRTQSEPGEVMRAIDPLISTLDPELVTSTSTLQDMLRSSSAFLASTLSAAVATSVGLLGLLLASMGIYGTVSYIVLLRTREIGIRMAMGAQKRNVLGLVIRQSTEPVLAGLLAGMALAVGVSYLLRGILFGVGTVDGISFAAVSLLFLTIALFGAYPPSRRAMMVDPIVALRHE